MTEHSIDELTWNDLDMDLIYQQMAYTRSSPGDDYLYYMLRNPVKEEEVLLDREKKISCLAENQELMTIEQLDQCLVDFQYANNLTASDMEALKSDDAEKILRLYLPVEAEKYLDVAGVAVRTIARLIDAELYPDKAFMTSEIEVNKGALQYVEGDICIHCGMVGNDDELLHTVLMVYMLQHLAKMVYRLN